MTVIDAFKTSNMWDARYNLPTSPQNNNPWFYMACASKLGCDLMKTYWVPLTAYFDECLNPDLTVNRWPKSFSQISHDELIGISYLNQGWAKIVYATLDNNDGVYNNTGAKESIPEEFNFARFPWFIEYVKARAGIKLTLISQLIWSLQLVFDMIKTKKGTDDASGRLLIWVMSEHMFQFPICFITILLWRWRMKVIGVTLKAMLTLEPRENPVMAQCAPEDFA